MASPIEQFQIKPIIPVISFTNSSLFMVGAAAVIVGGLLTPRVSAPSFRAAPSRSPRCCTTSSPTRWSMPPARRG